VEFGVAKDEDLLGFERGWGYSEINSGKCALNSRAKKFIVWQNKGKILAENQ
jgi:hypothetical protein